MQLKTTIRPFQIKRDSILLLDQRKLPHEQTWVTCASAEEVAVAIRDMVVRGAPAIGVTAAYGFYIGIWNAIKNGKPLTPALGERTKKMLDKSRPTAVNLFWATSLMQESYKEWIEPRSPKERKAESMSLLLLLFEKVINIQKDDASRCEKMSVLGADYIQKLLRKGKLNILTHCNTGALATAGIGTALGVIRALAARDAVSMVYADETRPYLQGARLTAWELKKDRIPVTLIVDSAGAALMKQGLIDLVITGADRITANGDTANKIGTYSLAIAAAWHKIPFFVAAPESTMDASLRSGDEIPIEMRGGSEILKSGEKWIAPKVPTLNYGFDVTDHSLIHAIFTEKRVFHPEKR